MTDSVTCETDRRGVATLTLNRPEKHNALNASMIEAMTGFAAALDADNTVRVVVLAGAGSSFCAGGDLNWMRAQMDADDATRAREARKLALMLKALNNLSKPLIGRIHGKSFGGGVGLASVCDLAVAAQGVAFGLTETRLGLIPATIGPYVVARMGQASARRVFMSARIFDADAARRLGLVAAVVPLSELDAAIESEVVPYFECAPGAVAEAKALLRAFGPVIDDTAIDTSIAALVTRWQSHEAAQGVDAFFARKAAPWVPKD